MTASPSVGSGESFERLFDALTAVGGRPRRSGQWKASAHCPLPGHAHEDRNPSLSLIYHPDTAKSQLRCHACGDGADVEVLEALGLGIADLYDEPRRRGERHGEDRVSGGATRRTPAPRKITSKSGPATQPRSDGAPAPKKTLGQLLETYVYLDAGGNPLMQVLRFEPKTFRQKRWNGQTWVWGAPEPAERALFFLPDVLRWAAAGETIHWTEGEKDCQALRLAGANATTAPMGAITADSKWQPQYAEQLAGAQLVLVHADRDYLKDKDLDESATSAARAKANLDHGAEHAARIKAELTQAGIRTIVVEAVQGKDVSDHLTAGLRVEDLLEVTDELLTARLMANTAALEAAEQAAAATSDAGASAGGSAGPRGRRSSAGLDRGQGHDRASVTGAPAHDEVSSEGHDAQIIEHPAQRTMPPPTFAVPMSSRQEWRYELGGEPGLRSRGVYTNLGHWTWVTPLPYLHARVVLRDGLGGRVGTALLASGTPDGPRRLLLDEDLRTGAWGAKLGLALSMDDKALKAAGTAIRYAAEDAPEHEATPRVVDGQIQIPTPESLPPGYLATSDATPEQATTALAELIALVAQSPKLALVLGASTIAPFLQMTRHLAQAHIVSIFGEPAKGKTTAMNLAAAVWGRPQMGGTDGTLRQWDSSPQGVPRYLGELGVLPGFFDEIGQASISGPAAWSKFIYDVCAGTQRLRPDRAGFTATKSWSGILFSSGNGRLLDGIGAGKYAGVERRVIEISAPFTLNEDHAHRIAPLTEDVAGHAGIALLRAHTQDSVRALVNQAAELVGAPDTPDGRSVAWHLHAHVAGAAMIDHLAGTGDTLTCAAAEYARQYLAELLLPQHDADRLIDAVRDAITSEPAMWPTRSAYAESTGLSQWTPDGQRNSLIPVHGVNRTVFGIQSDPDEAGRPWVGLFRRTWKAMADELDIDVRVAAQELYARGVLRVTPSRRPGSRRGSEWVCQVKVSGENKEVYKLVLPELPDDVDEDLDVPTPPTGTQPDPADDAPAYRSDGILTTEPAAPEQGAWGLPGATVDHQDSRTNHPGAAPAVSRGNTGATPGETDSEYPGEEPTATAVGGPIATAVGGETGLVGGEVGGAIPGLTCEVGDVGGNSDEASYVCAPAREDGSQIVTSHLPPGTSRPCVICLLPAWDLVDGRPCHLGECRRLLLEFGPDFRAGRPLRQGTVEVGGKTVSPAGTEAATGLDDVIPSLEPGGTSPSSTSSRRASQSRPERHDRQRFRGPAAVLDGQFAYLPGGEVHPWSAQHLGDVAVLASEKTGLRLGCGGGEDRPDQGQLWLTAAAVETLGLPAQLDWPADVDPVQWDKARKELFAPFDARPAVVEAIRAGWRIGSGQGHLQVWTKLQHPELLPRGAWLRFSSWDNTAPTALTSGDPEPAELVDRLARFAEAFTVPFRMGPAITGLRLIDHTRPPRQDENDEIGKRHNRAALVYGEPAELPPFLTNVDDPRFQMIEGDWKWWRLWEATARSSWSQLLDAEKECRYVHAYDRGASHFAPWGTIDLGLDGLTHRTGDEVTWDGKSERPGYYLVGPWEWPTWTLPDPGLAARAHAERGRWVTVHTLKQLHAQGVTPELLESYTWERTSRYLEPASKVIRAAKAHPDPMVSQMAKLVYTRTGGKLAQRRGSRSAAHLLRPDWYDHIVAMSRTAILHTLTKNLPGPNNPNGAVPLAVDHDAIFYASNDPDPISAWPGALENLGTTPGKWKVIGSGQLSSWGPEILVDQTPRTGFKGFRTWNYDAAVAALRRSEQDGRQDAVDETGSLEDEERLLSEEDGSDG